MVRKANYVGPLDYAPTIIGVADNLCSGLSPSEREGAEDFEIWKKKATMKRIKRKNKAKLEQMLRKYV